MSSSTWSVLLLLTATLACTPSAREPAVAAPDVASERAEFERWLATAATSPFRAIVQYPLAGTVTIGPDGSDIPLTGLGLFRIDEDRGRLVMTVQDASRPVWRDRLVSLGDYQLLATGLPGRTTLTLFGTELRDFKPPEYFPVSDGWRFDVALDPPSRGATRRLLAPDGSEVEATDAGTVSVPLATGEVSLQVFRLPIAGTEESELEINFRDDTNGAGSYPAGRFVSLVPAPGGRYRLDFNRARNPFCAYSAVYACPAPWRGNRIPAPVDAGERYSGGGLDAPGVDPDDG